MSWNGLVKETVSLDVDLFSGNRTVWMVHFIPVVGSYPEKGLTASFGTNLLYLKAPALEKGHQQEQRSDMQIAEDKEGEKPKQENEQYEQEKVEPYITRRWLNHWWLLSIPLIEIYRLMRCKR
jgi:hypothetical protein